MLKKQVNCLHQDLFFDLSFIDWFLAETGVNSHHHILFLEEHFNKYIMGSMPLTQHTPGSFIMDIRGDLVDTDSISNQWKSTLIK